MSDDTGLIKEGWRPIETAPKDRTIIVARFEENDEPLYNLADWFDSVLTADHPEGRSGWLEWYVTSNGFGVFADWATHWTPLPVAPSLGDRAALGRDEGQNPTELSGLPRFSDEDVERAARAHDAEDAAQMGEPSPWDIEFSPEQDTIWKAERIACMRAALEALGAKSP